MTDAPAERPYWTFLPSVAAPFLKVLTQQAENQGLAGVFAAQVHGVPFATLGAAAAASETLQIASGIAIASVRSPFETAMTAIDLDRISMGRFSLGLGASVHAWTHGFYGVAKRKPLTDLRETVEVVRYIIANAHKGLEPFKGEYFSADFDGFQPTEPPVREQIPIWIAAMQARSVQLAGEVGDGLMGHPMWSASWAEERIGTDLAAGLAKSGRSRQHVAVHLWPWAAPNDDIGEAIDDSRASVAFYAGAEQYEPYFEAHGFGAEARACQRHILDSDLAGAATCVTDDMVRTFVAVGTPDEVREQIERFWGVADALCPLPPAYGLEPDKLLAYSGRIAETLY